MSERVSKESYERLIANRPFKFDKSEVNYRKAEGEEKCEDCAHFFMRMNDRFNVCEIFRPTEGDESINPRYVCDFVNDGESFPLLDE